ncbi:hypothetical protein OG407_01690 [Streptomyces sp. NBC_01515]
MEELVQPAAVDCRDRVPTIVAIVADAENIVRDRLRRQLAPTEPKLV